MESAQLALLCLGINHRLAPVSILERALHEAEAVCRAFAGSVRHGEPEFPFAELAILATCNRVECYVACPPGRANQAANFLRSTLGPGAPNLYEHRDRDAIRHVCRVAAGLDSLVVGEPQIAGQVARAFEAVVQEKAGKSVLQAVAKGACRLGRRARAETGIARGPASISSVAVHVAAERIGGLAGRRVLILGAGKMGRLACDTLRNTRAHVRIANRTIARAEAVARRAGAEPVPLFPLAELLATADVVIASTASAVPLIGGDTVRRAFELRSQTDDQSDTMLIIDIAVPRNVSTAVHDIAGVQLIDIDDLQARAARHLDQRRQEIPRVEAMIEEELSAMSRQVRARSKSTSIPRA